jgi:predicted nucleotidyltransferase
MAKFGNRLRWVWHRLADIALAKDIAVWTGLATLGGTLLVPLAARTFTPLSTFDFALCAVVGGSISFALAHRFAPRRERDRPSLESLEDADLKTAASKWLRAKLSARGLHITNAALFGSIVHEHFKTSDVDVIVKFAALSERQIASAVRQIKGPLASAFERQFGHDLHVKFFCTEEVEGHSAFLASTKHETLF